MPCGDVGQLPGEGTQRPRERLSRAVALIGPLGQRDFQNLHHLGGHARIEAANVGWPRMHMLEEDRDGRRAEEWRAPRQRLVENTAERVDVRAFVNLAA